jgi:transposase-like protein
MKNDEVIAQIKKMNGNLAAVARAMGVSREGIRKHLQKHPSAQQALEESRETMLDNAESVLYKKALEGSTPELLFFLKTQGKSRGYIERQEVTGKDGASLSIELSWGDDTGNGDETTA